MTLHPAFDWREHPWPPAEAPPRCAVRGCDAPLPNEPCLLAFVTRKLDRPGQHERTRLSEAARVS